MMPEEQEKLESSLRLISPAAPPRDFMERLRTATVETGPTDQPVASPIFRWADWFAGWRRLAVAAPAAIIILLWMVFRPAPQAVTPSAASSTETKENAVQVGHSLIASFDTVAQLPGGEPVRFRCREWEDDVVIHDNAHGVVITKKTPRLEVTPVRFETY